MAIELPPAWSYSLIAGDGFYTYGMEFLDQANEVQDFWGIGFP